MSITESDVVDFIGVEKATCKVVLSIADHLDWEADPEDHQRAWRSRKTKARSSKRERWKCLRRISPYSSLSTTRHCSQKRTDVRVFKAQIKNAEEPR
jgi:Family of unknown function (DUF6572)